MKIIFSKILKIECFYRGITLKQLSTKTGIPYATLLSYTKNENTLPRCDIILKLASVLNVSMEYLLTGENSINKDLDLKRIDPRYLKPLSLLIHELTNTEQGN